MTVPIKPSLQAVLRARQIDEDLSEVVDTLGGACWRLCQVVAAQTQLGANVAIQAAISDA